VTDTDPIVGLADTLYDALYAITPYAELHFADENTGLENAVRAVLTQAAAQQWIQKQLDQTGIRAMDFRNGVHMELEPARELLAHQVAAARTMLGDAPNYTETKVEWDVKVAESPEMYTLVVQRHAPGALTPHEARQKAEARVAAVLAECDALEAEVHGQHDEDDDGIREAVRRIRARAQEASDG
jgi:cell division septum initiation protein DivIVA